jgi:hypothetical protein
MLNGISVEGDDTIAIIEKTPDITNQKCRQMSTAELLTPKY